jgi:hypothetical protein
MRKIFEEYVESADYKISVFFKELKSQIVRWFSEGSLAAQGCKLDGEIQISNYNPMEKFLIFNFFEYVSDVDDEDIFRYRVVFMIRLDEMTGSNNGDEMSQTEGKSLDIEKILLKIHQFDEDNVEKGELVEEISIEDIKEDFLINKLGQLKDKSTSTEEDDSDLKDNIFVK